MTPTLTLQDMIRELERLNFHHVNDTDELKRDSYGFCQDICNKLIQFMKREEKYRNVISEVIVNLAQIEVVARAHNSDLANEVRAYRHDLSDALLNTKRIE